MTDTPFRGEDLERFAQWRTVHTPLCIACGNANPRPWAESGSYRAVRCEGCGLIWMNPSLSETGMSEYYADYIGRRRLSDEKKMEQRRVQYLADRAFIERFASSGKVLDVGCSGGFFLEALSPAFEKHGVEIDPEAVRYARENQSDWGKNIICSALSDAPYETGQFDLVMMRGTIEHLPDPVGAIARVSALLKQGGHYFVTATPNGDSFAAELYRDKWTLFHPLQHPWHFSPRSLELIGLRANLKLIAWDFPYLGTPYENVREDVRAVADAIKAQERNPSAVLPVSPPFWGNMMSLVFQKA